MKQPTAQQLEQLQRISQYKDAVEYLQLLEAAYINRLIGADEESVMRKLQGSIETVQLLLKHITMER